MRHLLLAAMCASGLASRGIAGPLETAKEMAANEFKDWKYGPSATKQQVDCVQFVAAVVQREIGRDLTREETAAILVSPAPADLTAAVESEDPLMRGVQRALVDIVKRGAVIKPTEAQAGDFIQYWIRKTDGTWSGHAAIISRVFDVEGVRRASIYSSHKSTGGIAELDFGGAGLKLRGSDRKVYIARLQ